MGRGPDEDGNLVYEGYSDDPDDIDSAKDVANWNNYVYFGTMLRSMFTLFNIVILAEFPEIGRPMIEKQPGMIVFFVIFIVFTTFGVLNVIIGVIVDNTMEAAKSMEKDLDDKEKKAKIALLTRIRDMVFALDKDESGSISVEEIEEGWQEPQLRELLADINLPKGWTPGELMCLLDADGDGELTFEEFMRSFYRLIASDPFQQSCCMHASLNEVKQELKSSGKEREESEKELKEQISKLEEKMDKRLAKIERMLTRFGSDAYGGRPDSDLNGTAYGDPKRPGSRNRRLSPAADFDPYRANGQSGNVVGVDTAPGWGAENVPRPSTQPYSSEFQPPRPPGTPPQQMLGSLGTLPNKPVEQLLYC